MTDTAQTTPEVVQEPIKAPPLPYTLHANLKDYRRRLGSWRILLALGLSFFFLYKFGWIGWIISVASIALLIGIILWFLGKRSVTITTEGLEAKNALGRVRKIAYGEIEGAKVFINFLDTAFGAMPRLSIAQKSDKEGITLVGMFWPLEELDKLIAVLQEKKITVEYYEDILPYTVIVREFPKYGTYVERHPGKIVAISLAVIIPACIAVALFITFAL